MSIFKNVRKLTLQEWMFSLAIFLLGTILLVASHQLFHDHPIIESNVEVIAKVLMLILPLEYLRERLNHHQDAEAMITIVEVEMKLHFDEMERKLDLLQTKIMEANRKLLEDHFPTNQRLQDMGPADMTPNFDSSKLISELNRVHNSEFFLNKIYALLPRHFVQALHEAIVKNGNNVRILLADPHAVEALTKRADVTNTTTREIQRCINRNLDVFAQLYYAIPAEHRSKLTVKLHRSFIAASVVGYEGVIWEGTYLSGRLSTDGNQKKFLSSTQYYHELLDHFEREWNGKHTKTVDLANWWADPANQPKRSRSKRSKTKHTKDGESSIASVLPI